jgi:hypothetical protein
VATHYDTLGVRPGADQAAIRSAYLAKARAHHPDRHVDASPAVRASTARTMREVNAAWAVLSDPAARRDYDARLAAQARPSSGATGASRAPGPGSPPRPPGPAGRPAGPGAPGTARPGGGAAPGRPLGHGDDDADLVGRGIRLLPVLAVLALLLGIFVFTAFAATSDTGPPTTTLAPGDLAAGMCVRAARVLTVVPCSDAHDATVVSVGVPGRPCPAGTSVYTVDRTRVACLRPSP